MIHTHTVFGTDTASPLTRRVVVGAPSNPDEVRAFLAHAHPTFTIIGIYAGVVDVDPNAPAAEAK